MGVRTRVVKIRGEGCRHFWAPSVESSSSRLFASTSASSSVEDSAAAAALDELNQKIAAKGEEIRQMKVNGMDKQALAPQVQELLALKAQLPTSATTVSPPDAPAKSEKTNLTSGGKTNNGKKQKKEAISEVELSESEIKLNRLSKVKAMREAGVEPFEYSYAGTTSAAQLTARYDGKLEPGEEDEDSDVAVAGRVMTRRVFGKLAFFTMQDESGTIQLQFDSQRLGDSFQVRSSQRRCNMNESGVSSSSLFVVLMHDADASNHFAFLWNRASKIGQTGAILSE